MAYNKIKVLLGADSSSSGTSPTTFVGDARLLSLSVITSTTSASRYTISLSNDDGFQSAVVNWSVATTIVNAGVFVVDPGSRWLRAERPNFGMGSAASMSTVLLNKYYQA
jgi:hypothetical protein